MTDLMFATRPGYDTAGYPLNTTTGPRCGNCRNGVRHATVAIIRACYVIEADQHLQMINEQAAEAAYERHLEDRGYWEAQAQDDYEARLGIPSFTEAWHAASPDTCPCCND